MLSVLIASLFLVFPAFILYLVHNQNWANRLGAILLCYAAGLILGNSGVLPENAVSLQNTLSEVAIAIGLPLLLFSLNIKAWFSMAGKAMLSLFLAMTSVVAMTTLLILMWPFGDLSDTEQFAGLAVGVYTGGTPNLAAIKVGLSIPDDRYILFHTFDTLLGATYLLFMLAAGKQVFGRLLPAFKAQQPSLSTEETDITNEDYREFFHRPYWIDTLKALGVSVLIVSISMGLAEIVPINNTAAFIIVCLTTLGLLASLVPAVNQLKASYKAGMYLIYVFSFVVASMADFSNTEILNPTVFLYILAVIVFSLVMHALLCRLFNVDMGTFMVTSVACICSPPFVPMIAKTLGNPTLLISGFTTGLVGYAVGNYLGISLALILAPYL